MTLAKRCAIIPLQFLPSPSKPSLHLHSKLPILLIQRAFSEQSSLLVAHSSTSTGKCRYHSTTHTYVRMQDFTSTSYSIALIACPTFTLKATRSIHAISISITIICVQSTFIDVYMTKKEYINWCKLILALAIYPCILQKCPGSLSYNCIQSFQVC